jgi:uncharacterized protein (TIGR02266 family)
VPRQNVLSPSAASRSPGGDRNATVRAQPHHACDRRHIAALQMGGSSVGSVPREPGRGTIVSPMTWMQRARRCQLSVPIDMEDKRGWQRGLTQNLGVGGIFVASEHPGRPGDLIVLRFALPGLAEPLLVEAEVCWIRKPGQSRQLGGPGMGLKFANLSSQAASAIDGFLRSRTRAE